MEKQRVDVLENHLMDLRMAFARLCYSPDFVSAPPGGWGGWVGPRGGPRGGCDGVGGRWDKAVRSQRWGWDPIMGCAVGMCVLPDPSCWRGGSGGVPPGVPPQR